MVAIEKDQCTGCGKCAADCITGSLQMQDGKAAYTKSCIMCGHCVALCPAAAVSIPEYDMEDVLTRNPATDQLDPEALLRVLKLRRSVRFFKDRAIEQEKLEYLVQAGRYTATGGNRQACRFVAVQDQLDALKAMVWDGFDAAIARGDEVMKQLKHLSEMRKTKGIDYLFRNAPAVIYIAADSVVDASLAAQSIEFAAVAQGLGLMYNGYLVRSTMANEQARAFLQCSDKPIQVCMLAGYPSVTYPRSAPRKKADAFFL